MIFTYPDRTKPTVTSFTATRRENSHTVTINPFTGSDANVPATGPSVVQAYLITASSTDTVTVPTAPTVADLLNQNADISPWSRTAPTTYVASAAGRIRLYPWVVDSAGNVSPIATPQIVDVPEIIDLTVSINRVSTQSTPTSSPSIQFLVTFSKPIDSTTFLSNDVIVTN